jgi:predicted Zn-dependent protease
LSSREIGRNNQKQAVGAVSPQQDALVALQLASAPNAQQAARQFFSQQGIEALEPWHRQIGGFTAVSSTFAVQTQEGVLLGLVAWVEYQERVFQIIGYTPGSRWGQYNRLMADAIASFSRETDRAVLGAQPRRLSIVDLNRPATLEALLRDYPSTVDPKTVALITTRRRRHSRPAVASSGSSEGRNDRHRRANRPPVTEEDSMNFILA